MNRTELIQMIQSYLSTQDDMHELAGFVEGLVDKAEKRGHINGFKRGVVQSGWVKEHVKDATSAEGDGPSVFHYLADRDFDVWQKEQKNL